MVGMMRIELTTFCPPDKRANQAALHPDLMTSNILFFFSFVKQKMKISLIFFILPGEFSLYLFCKSRLYNLFRKNRGGFFQSKNIQCKIRSFEKCNQGKKFRKNGSSSV